MRDELPSLTAAWVAACRGLGALLPEPLRLADDPYGLHFAGRGAVRFAEAARRFPALAAIALRRRGRLRRQVLWLQVRTRAIDDVLLDFLRAGGRQVLLLGAGFDCRAARFARELSGATVFEVDHPATQARKRRVLAEAGFPSTDVTYLEWDFERRPLTELPAALAARGHDPARPTLTIWEGVSLYLSEDAIEATVAAVRALSAPESVFAFTYLDRAAIEHPDRWAHMLGWIGEPFRFGWEPAALPRWLEERGFILVWDREGSEIGEAYLPARDARLVRGKRRIAVARRAQGGTPDITESGRYH